MTFEDAIQIMYESENDRMLDEMYSEDPRLGNYEPDFEEIEIYDLMEA